MKNITLAIALSVMLPFTAAHAALITVNDGDVFNYDPLDTYQFTGSLSTSDSMLTYGVNLDFLESFDFYVNAPSEFDLYAIVKTGPNGTGVTIANPSSNSSVPAGTTAHLHVSGNTFVGMTNWLTIMVKADALAVINTDYAGSLPVGSLLAGTTALYDPNTGGGNSGNGGTGDGGTSLVPEPGTLPLMLAGIAVLGLISKRRFVS